MKPAETEHDLHTLIKERWSPRAFDPAATLTQAEISELFEAARWSPSASNSQPWRFLYGLRGDPTFNRILENLKPGNSRWAFRAGALAVGVARVQKADGSPETHGSYDTGQAVAHLAFQAQHRGLSVHQMAGFLPSIDQALSIPANYRTVVAFTIGKQGESTLLEPDLAEREKSPRARRSLSAIAHNGNWTPEFDS